MKNQYGICEWCGNKMENTMQFGCIVDVTYYPNSSDSGEHRKLCLCGRCAESFSDLLELKTERVLRQKARARSK